LAFDAARKIEAVKNDCNAGWAAMIAARREMNGQCEVVLLSGFIRKQRDLQFVAFPALMSVKNVATRGESDKMT